MATIGENLRRLRKAKGMSQQALASKSGVTQQLISQIESEQNQSTKELSAFARALGVAVHDIDETFVSGATDEGYGTVELRTDGPTRLLLQYKFLGDPDPTDAELIDLLSKTSPAEREEFLFLLRHRHGEKSSR